MWRVFRGTLLSLVCCCAVGCQSFERQELESERSRPEQSQNDLRGYLDRSAPIGSRWASHTDTAAIVEQMNCNSLRINEIDEELRHR